MLKTTIKSISAREILDSRGKPTLEVSVTCEGDGKTCLPIGRFGVPSGASTGTNEALELRDGDPRRYDGLGVLKAIANVNGAIAQAVIGMDAGNQHALDKALLELDGTPNKSRLGGNAIIGVSVAAAKAAAAASGLTVVEYLRELAPDIKPSHRVPFMNMNLINGGKHAAGKLAFQEYKVVPQTDDIEEAIRIGATLMYALKKTIISHLGTTSANIGDEGGFAPDIGSVRKPLELLMGVAVHAGLANRIKLALDIGASAFYANGMYEYDGAKHTTAELELTIRQLIKDFPILYVEDPFNEDKFEDFARLNKDSGVIIVGDDLTVTNSTYLLQAIKLKAISGVIIKPNQVGTLTETLACMKLARDHDIECIVSHRSGETSDDFIADLAVAFGVFGIKAGAPQRGERVAKYNRFRELLSSKI